MKHGYTLYEFENSIQLLAIISCYIFNVRYILQTSLYFREEAPASSNCSNSSALIQIFRDDKCLFLTIRFTVRIYHIKSKATELGTFSPIGTTSETSLTNITLSTIAYTQSTMYKYLQRHIRTDMDISYLNKRNFTSRYSPDGNLPQPGILLFEEYDYPSVCWHVTV